jgi:hypothetical protein
MLLGSPPLSKAAVVPGSDLATGIRQVEQGDFGGALMTLDPLVQRLSAQKLGAERAQAQLYAAAAYFGLGQMTSARGKLLEAMKSDPGLRVSAERFPTGLVQMYEQARRAQETSAPSDPDAGAKKSNTGKVLLIAGAGAAVAGVAIAIAAGSSNDNNANPRQETPAPPPTASPATTTPPPPANNQAPSVRIVDVQPRGSLITFVTEAGFSANGSDPDGDNLTYTWDFGDETPPLTTGAGIAHNYGVVCNCLVKVTASDGKGGTAVSTQTVTVAKLDGNWHAVFSSGSDTFTNLSQARTGVSGKIAPGVTFTGRVDSPRTMTLDVSSRGCDPPASRYVGVFNERLDRIVLTGSKPDYCGNGGVTLLLTR